MEQMLILVILQLAQKSGQPIGETMRRFFFLILIAVMTPGAPAVALERQHPRQRWGHQRAATAIFVAKDLGIFEKYGLEVEPLVITGGSTLLQALVGRSIHSANVAAMAPVRAIASGADLAITATFLNKNLYSFIARKEIHSPADLRRQENRHRPILAARINSAC